MAHSVVEVMEAAGGGTAKHVTGLCRELSREGFEVTLIASLRRNPNFAHTMDELTGHSTRCIALDMHREVNPVADAKAYSELKRLLKELRPDVVHGHASKGGWLARAAAHAVGIENTVYTPHCFAFAADIGPLRKLLYRRAERMAGRWTARLVAVSRHEARLAAEVRILPSERITCIPNGLGDNEFAPPRPDENLRTQLGLRPDETVIGFVGRLCPQKAADILIQAFAQISNRNPDCQLLIIGDGPEREELEELARTSQVAEKVVFAGERDDVAELMALMNIFAMPSRWESAPYAILEAMASDVPIVASRTGGVPELLDEGSCGVLVEPDNPTELAEGIVSLISNRERAEALADAARKRVRDEYRLSRTVSMTANLYRELVEPK